MIQNSKEKKKEKEKHSNVPPIFYVFLLFQVLEIPRAPDMSGKEPHHVIAVLEIPQPEQEELEAADSDVTPQAQVWKSKSFEICLN